MNADTRQFLATGATLAGMAAIAVLSLMPIQVPEVGVQMQDKLLHLLAYAALGLAMALAGVRPLWAVLAIVAFGGVLEVLQGLTGYRQSEWLDLLADGVGAAIGVGAAQVGRRT